MIQQISNANKEPGSFLQSYSNILSVDYACLHGYNMAATTLNLSSFHNNTQKKKKNEFLS